MTDKIRLPAGVKPENYNLFFDIDLEKFVFSGRETISLIIDKPTKNIVLHSTGLEIRNVQLVAKGKTLKPKIKEDKNLEQLMFIFGENVSAKANLLIEFEGKLDDSLAGLYRSKYIVDGKEKYLATTQFEAPYARKAFPCFDEPAQKATFDVTMKVNKNLQAISNMPIVKEVNEGNKKFVTFQTTPKMSTYLLYLGAGEFEFLESRAGKVLVRVVTTEGKKNQAAFALEMTKKVLKYFEDYSGVKYPLPKLDMIAIPDFASGAMENWGAITFREVLLLFDNRMTSISVKKRIAEVIAHELWHQWSGNLVTMEWWNDLWLNESFATYMGYKATDHYFPEWEMWKDFALAETDNAFDADSIMATHPIEVEVKDPKEINEIFDSISYDKGANVLRMLENYMGPENFRRGISRYLKKHSYGNATAEDLWTFLALASKEPLKKVAAAWIRQPGYPLVTAVRKGNSVALSQKRFVFNASDKTLWPVPLVIKTDKKVLKILLDKKEKSVPLGKDWFKLNYEQTGFYRVKYGEEELANLKPLVENRKLAAIDRWGIQSDLFRLARHGEVTLDKYLDFVKSYDSENDYTVLRSVYGSLRSIYFVFSQEPFWKNIEPALRGMFTETFAAILDKLGWEPSTGEKESTTLLRNLAISYLGFAEDEETKKIAREKFDNYVNTGTIHPNLRGVILSIVSDSGDEDVYNKLIEIYKRSSSPEEKIHVLGALGNFQDPKLLEKALNFSLSANVRKQDLYVTFSSASGNPFARDLLLGWADKNWKTLESHKHSHSIFFHIVESLITAFVTRDREKELRKFFRKHPVEYKMILGKSFDRLERNIFWLEHNRKALEDYFS